MDRFGISIVDVLLAATVIVSMVGLGNALSLLGDGMRMLGDLVDLLAGRQESAVQSLVWGFMLVYGLAEMLRWAQGFR